MASGTLGQGLATTSPTSFYTVGATPSVFNVELVNLTGFPVGVTLSISSSATVPTTSEYLEYQTVIPGNGVLDRGGIVATAGKYVVASATVASAISVNVYGYEG